MSLPSTQSNVRAESKGSADAGGISSEIVDSKMALIDDTRLLSFRIATFHTQLVFNFLFWMQGVFTDSQSESSFFIMS